MNTILDFLLEQFDVGKQYHTINTIRSAISMTHEHFDEVAVGQHPLVTRFFWGVFNSRPPAPQYSSTWDVNRVLSYLKSLLTDDPLPLTLLSYKLAVLFALANADRSSDLAALDLRFLTYQEMESRSSFQALPRQEEVALLRRRFMPASQRRWQSAQLRPSRRANSEQSVFNCSHTSILGSNTTS